MGDRPALLFDFFGTLVDYSPSRVDQGYHRSHALLTGWGASDLGYQAFLDLWSDVSSRFDARSDLDDREFSMHELGDAFLTEALHRSPAHLETVEFVATYLAEWNTGVRPIAGVADVIDELAASHRLAVVTNTHDAGLVPGHLTAMGIAHQFEAVITSVEVGWRKPHAAIFQCALDALAIRAADAIFIGDTRAPDYDGPVAMGMRALLIDPDRVHDIPIEDALDSVLDLPVALANRT